MTLVAKLRQTQIFIRKLLPICFQKRYSAFQWQIQKDGDGDDNGDDYDNDQIMRNEFGIGTTCH